MRSALCTFSLKNILAPTAKQAAQPTGNIKVQARGKLYSFPGLLENVKNFKINNDLPRPYQLLKVMPYQDRTDQILWQQLYESRCQIGLVRQPFWASYLDALRHTVVKYKPGLTAFDTIWEINEKLCSVCLPYDPAGQWLESKSDSPKAFYRLETCTSFLSRHRHVLVSQQDGGYGFAEQIFDSDLSYMSKDEPPVEAAEFFKNMIRHYLSNEKKPLILNKLISQFFGRRGISWWTTDFDENHVVKPTTFVGPNLTLNHTWLIELAHKVGMVNNWLDDNMLLLKLEPDKVLDKTVRVPSVIDAFDQPIFDPTEEKSRPTEGQAIWIQEKLTAGHKEYVLNQVEVAAGSFIPIKINKDQLASLYHHSEMSDDLLKRLINYIPR